MEEVRNFKNYIFNASFAVKNVNKNNIGKNVHDEMSKQKCQK